MATLTRYIAGVLFGLLIASPAFAQDYFWSISGIHNFYSLSAACAAGGASIGATRTAGTVTNATSALCTYYGTFEGGQEYVISTDYVTREGDGCSGGKEWNATNGACELPANNELKPGEKCPDQTGGTASNPMVYDSTTSSCRRFTESEGDAPCAYLKGIGDNNPTYGGSKYTVAGNINSAGDAVAPPSFANSINCQITTISSSECIYKVGGQSTCDVIGKYSGKANPQGEVDAADASCDTGKDCPKKEPLVETKNEACVPVGTGGGGTSCTETKQTTAEGSQSCGTVNGAYKCITKKPASNGLTSNIKATSQTLPDGSIKVTTVKDSSNTVCTDVNTCTTKTSTTTTHSTTSPSGGTKTETSCSGACNANGGGVDTNPGAGTGTGNGTGNGNGTCTGDDCGEGEDGTASTTEECTAIPPCEGDPFQCAILQQAHLDTCKLMAGPTAAEQGEMDAKVAKSQADLVTAQTDMDAQVNTLLGGFQAATSGGGTGGGKCLPDIPFSVMGHSMDMKFSDTCESISFIRLAIIAMAYLYAARVVFSEV